MQAHSLLSDVSDTEIIPSSESNIIIIITIIIVIIIIIIIIWQEYVYLLNHG